MKVTQHTVDWNDLAWSTLQNLGATGPSPGPDNVIEEYFRKALCKVALLPTVYVNPRFRIIADGPSYEFLREARRAQRTWLSQAKQVLATRSELRRQMRAKTPLMRQLAFTGVMVVSGRSKETNDGRLKGDQLA